VRAAVDALLRRAERPPLPAIAQPTEIAAASATLGPGCSSVVQRALTRVGARRADAQDLLSAALAFPQEIVEATGAPMLVLADEFQYILDLAAYAPFDGGRRNRMEKAQEQVLSVIREQLERQQGVGWVVTGSAVRLMQRILREGPLMGRFDEYSVGALDDYDTGDLAVAVWKEEGVEPTDAAINRVFRITQGHPFYVDAICRRAAVAALRFGRPVSTRMVEGAFLDAVQSPTGVIGVVCREMYDSLAQRAPVLREVLHVLARREPATLAEIADGAQLSSPALAYRRARELAEMGILQELDRGTYGFADPVFRYWVAVANDPLLTGPVPLNPDAPHSRFRLYEEAYLRERQVHGVLQEGYLRDLCRSFAGQKVPGRRLGVLAAWMQLPHVISVEAISAFDAGGRVLGKPSDVELDLRFGGDVDWLCEVRRRAGPTGLDAIVQAHSKATFLREAHRLRSGPTWFISMSGFGNGVRARARELG
jgi:hypothetical protein